MTLKKHGTKIRKISKCITIGNATVKSLLRQVKYCCSSFFELLKCYYNKNKHADKILENSDAKLPEQCMKDVPEPCFRPGSKAGFAAQEPALMGHRCSPVKRKQLNVFISFVIQGRGRFGEQLETCELQLLDQITRLRK